MANEDRIEKIKSYLNDDLKPIKLEISDDSHLHVGHPGAKDGAGHYTINIQSELFHDKTMVERHRMIYNALETMMHSDIHALRIYANPPEEGEPQS